MPERIWHFAQPPHNTGYKLLGALCLLVTTLSIVALTAVQAYFRLIDVTQLTEERTQSRTLRLQLVETLSLIKDLETGARGFVLTGQDSYLNPFLAAETALPPLLQNVGSALAAHEPAQTEWTELERLVLQRIRLARTLVENHRHHPPTTEAQQALLSEGKSLMDQIRTRFHSIDQQQQHRIDRINTAILEAHTRAAHWTWLAIGLPCLLIGVAMILLLREHRQRLKLEQHLYDTNCGLEQQVQERTASLAQARDEIAHFAAAQNQAIEEERRRLSREVHDQIGQIFSAIRLIASSIDRAAFPPRQEEALQDALRQGIDTTRRITAELRPPLLDDFGLNAALEYFIDQRPDIGNLRTQVILEDDQRLSPDQALTLFRIAQEAITNVQRHAHARQIDIQGHAQADHYDLCIRDDGCGLGPPPYRPGALGLISMRERATLAGGTCDLRPGPQGGTQVTVQIPLHAGATHP